MLGRDDPLQPVEHPLVVPGQESEKLLERPGRHAGRQSDRLDALAIEVRQLTADVDREVFPAAMIVEAVGESTDEPIELREKRLQGVSVHARFPEPVRGPEFEPDDARWEAQS